MKRPLLTIVIFLLLGAVVNVAVAWGCAIAVTDYKRARGVLLEGVNSQPGYALLVFWAMGSEFVVGTGGPLPGHTLERVDPTYWDWSLLRKGGGPEVLSVIIAEEARGWPFRCLRCYWKGGKIRGGVDLGGGRRNYQLENGVQTSISFPNDAPRNLPLIPIWHGLLLNVLFYTSLLMSARMLHGTVRQHMRVRRGLCPKCAYPMGESSVCTECGIALPRRRRRVAQGGSAP